jgi:hypothetical protein
MKDHQILSDKSDVSNYISLLVNKFSSFPASTEVTPGRLYFRIYLPANNKANCTECENSAYVTKQTRWKKRQYIY